ncbi:Hypothetical protein GLP15_3016 [Giardia lamblia P15]|uniref:Uncharacterized protein n=1 Tax=Giardia intestinalis (strain P15) TaxID=658858 RepID=E1F6P7_GIAIA|nr:Hypothetical protein GLP15_3016 [Giardia lamblia P15]
MGRASESPRTMDILSVAEIQQIHNFRLDVINATGNVPSLLIDVLGELFTYLGIESRITGSSLSRRVQRILRWYHTLRVFLLILISVSLFLLQLRVTTELNFTESYDVDKQFSGFSALLRIIYWILAPIYLILDRLGCLVHTQLLSTQADKRINGPKSFITPPILSIYWQLVGDALLSAVQVFISITPAILYQFQFGASFCLVFLTSITIMMHTITALRESTSLQPAFSFWIRSIILQRVLTILLCLVHHLNKIIIVQLFIPKTFLFIVLAIAIYFLPPAAICFTRQIIVERANLQSHRADLTWTESLIILKQSTLSRQELRLILHRFINGTYSAAIAMLSIVVPLYLIIYRGEEVIQGAQNQSFAQLTVLGTYIYGLIVCSLQFRALLCFLRGSLEWDKRIEPYLIFYPLVMPLLYRLHITKPHRCYSCLIVLLVFMHYSIVRALYKELHRI